MPEIRGITATDVVKKSIDYVLKHGKERLVWGGTIPEKLNDPNSPNDYDRLMIEMEDPIVMVLQDPLKRWCDWSDHSTFITLRETEDHLQHYNPGHITKYTPLYKQWIDDGYFNYTYGERLCKYPYNIEEQSGKAKRIGWDLNQVERVIGMLRKHPSTRKAVISTWYPPTDLGNNYCPCNCLFQIFERDGLLNWTTVIRSLDVLRGFTENLFMFTLWQEYIAHELEMDVGAYKTVALNAHLYKDMIDSGYHKQNPPDPYNYYERQTAFETPFPSVEFRRIDDLLHRDTSGRSFEKILSMCLDLPEYWSNWKIALVGDWYRKKKHPEITKECITHISNEFAFPVTRYLNDPDAIMLLQSFDQQDYLAKLL